MTIFALMHPIRRALHASWSVPVCLLLAASFAGAKSPEDFLGPTSPATAPAPAKAPAAQAKAPAAPAPAAPAPAAPAASAAKTAAPASAAAPDPKVSGKPAPKATMDTAKLHATYLDGDFDQAIRVMEGALKNKKSPLTHADSVFIFKHLGVMYAATPATREKGRYYMTQLIYIEPTAKILDMYASDMIYMIFRNVQEEFANKNPNVAKPVVAAVDTVPASAAAPAAPAAMAASQGASPRRNKAYWITGGAVVAVGAIGLVYVLMDDPEPKRHTIVVTE